MTQPTNYTPTTDFSQQESINASGRSTVNTAALDAEFANIETTLDQTVSNLSLIQRDDGRLKDVSVEIHTISPEVLNLIGGGYALRGLWAEATVYALNDICSNGAYTYVCRTAHTASGLFDGQYWTQFGFTSGADAAQAAAAAQGSATSAAGSATAAGNSAIAAAASASSISGSVASASSYASIATTKAGDAASSATAAGNSAVSAAASAASINTTTFALKTGVGSSGTWPISITGNASTATSAANGGVTSVNGSTGAVTVAVGVTSVNGNAGAISAAQIAAAAVASWGYTPPNPSGLNADTVDGYHYNNLPYAPNDTNGAVGEYAFAAQHTGSPVANGATLNGSYVYRYVLQSGVWTQGAAMGGTCRNISGATASSSGATLGIWQRIA